MIHALCLQDADGAHTNIVQVLPDSLSLNKIVGAAGDVRGARQMVLMVQPFSVIVAEGDTLHAAPTAEQTAGPLNMLRSFAWGDLRTRLFVHSEEVSDIFGCTALKSPQRAEPDLGDEELMSDDVPILMLLEKLKIEAYEL